MRLDQYLFAEGLAPSRERAHALVMAGHVYVNDVKADKPGSTVREGALVEVRGDDNPFVSRGGLKLQKALDAFDVLIAGKVCMDVGASTGGFTDCMLQHGAAKVYAVDVGYGQLAWPLRNDPRVIVMERTNIRHVDTATVPETIDFFSIDTSFISLKLVLPAVRPLVKQGAEGVCLVKPQFEAGKDKVGKNGVVRDIATHQTVLKNCIDYANSNSFSVDNIDYSPIKGPKGNIEYLLHVVEEAKPKAPDDAQIIALCERAHQMLD